MIGPTNATTVTGAIDPGSVTVGSDTKPIKLVNGVATAVSNDLVSTAGAQSIYGSKAFMDRAIFDYWNPELRLNSGHAIGFNVRLNVDEYNVAPVADKVYSHVIFDKNSTQEAKLQYFHGSSGTKDWRIHVTKDDGTDVYAELLRQLPDGTTYTTSPHRSYASASSDDVLVKGHIANITDLVHTTGNETINGVKDFKDTLMSNGIFSNKCAQNIESTSIWRRLYYTSSSVSNQVLTLLITSQKGTIFEGGILIIYGGNNSVNMSWLAKGIDTVTSNYVVVQRTDGIHEVWVKNVNGNRGLCAIKLNETNWGSPSYFWVVDATTTSSTFDPTDTSKYSVYAISS